MLWQPSTVLFVLWLLFSVDIKIFQVSGGNLRTCDLMPLPRFPQTCTLTTWSIRSSKFFLQFPQCTQNFHLHLPKTQIEVQITGMHTHRCYFLLSYSQISDTKKCFTTVRVKTESRTLFLLHLTGVVKSHSYLQISKFIGQMKGCCWDFFLYKHKYFLICLSISVSLPFHCYCINQWHTFTQ